MTVYIFPFKINVTVVISIKSSQWGRKDTIYERDAIGAGNGFGNDFAELWN